MALSQSSEGSERFTPPRVGSLRPAELELPGGLPSGVS